MSESAHRGERTCLVHLGRLQQHVDDHVQRSVVCIGNFHHDWVCLVQQRRLVVQKRDRKLMRTMSNTNENVSYTGTKRDQHTHMTLADSSLVTGIKDTGRNEFNHRGTARLDSRDAQGSWGTSIVQLPSFRVTTMLETYAIDPVIMTEWDKKSRTLNTPGASEASAPVKMIWSPGRHLRCAPTSTGFSPPVRPSRTSRTDSECVDASW